MFRIPSYFSDSRRSFVAVKITGLAVERFINVAAHNGVYMWDVAKTHEECLTLRLPD